MGIGGRLERCSCLWKEFGAEPRRVHTERMEEEHPRDEGARKSWANLAWVPAGVAHLCTCTCAHLCTCDEGVRGESRLAGGGGAGALSAEPMLNWSSNNGIKSIVCL